jgi:hypothetical protein
LLYKFEKDVTRVFGTFENLWNDGYKDAGKNFGKFLAKQLQMQRK